MNFLFFSGSFRAKSRSLAIIQIIQTIFKDHQYQTAQLDRLPFFNADLNNAKPDSILSLIEQVNHSDGIIVCTPEYNHSIPAVLKNAIDWASRPAFKSPLKGKPVSIITQGTNLVGGARAQAHLKLIFDSTFSIIHSCHEMMIPTIDQVLDEDMQITNQKVMERLTRHINDFVEFIEKTRQA